MFYTIILLLLTYMAMLSDKQLLTFSHELVIELLTTIPIPYNYFVRQVYDTPNMCLCQVDISTTLKIKTQTQTAYQNHHLRLKVLPLFHYQQFDMPPHLEYHSKDKS